MLESQKVIFYFSQENLKWIQENNPKFWKRLLTIAGAGAIDTALLGLEFVIASGILISNLHEEKKPE